MKSIQKIQIAAASVFTGLLLCGCGQQSETPSTSAATPDASTQAAPAMASAPLTNNPTDSTTNAPSPIAATAPMPESTMPTSTNQLPAATPVPSSP